MAHGIPHILAGRSAPKRGFTLVEILIVSAITALLAGVSISGFAAYSRNQALDGSAAVLAAGLRDARAQTLASVGGSQYGVAIEPTRFVFFQGSSYNATSPSNRPFELSSYVRASSTQAYYVFERVTGNAVASGTIDIYLVSDSTQIRMVSVASTGLVDVE